MLCEPRPMFRAMELGVADDSECAGHEQAAQIAIPLFADTAEFVSTPARVLPGNQSDPSEKLRPERKVLGLPTLATRAVANSGPPPGMQLRRLLISLERCQAIIIRSKSKICFLRLSNWLPSAA